MTTELRALLDAAFEGEFSDDDFEHALGGDHALVTTADGRLVAHAAIVPRTLFAGEQRLAAGYVEAVATLPDVERRGYGTRAMRALEPCLQRHEFAALSTGSHAFYERLGWARWAGETWVLQTDGGRLRSADEDGGIMYRRTAATPPLDVRWPLCCTARSGDDW